jgi:hypothetical protein
VEFFDHNQGSGYRQVLKSTAFRDGFYNGGVGYELLDKYPPPLPNLVMSNAGYAPISQDPSSFTRTSTPIWRTPNWAEARTWLRLRPIAIFVAISLVLLSGFYWGSGKLSLYLSPKEPLWASDATNFDSIFLREDRLPQHNLSAPYPEGKDGRYLRFSNQVWGTGSVYIHITTSPGGRN